jgi:hypothetical protein
MAGLNLLTAARAADPTDPRRANCAKTPVRARRKTLKQIVVAPSPVTFSNHIGVDGSFPPHVQNIFQRLEAGQQQARKEQMPRDAAPGIATMNVSNLVFRDHFQIGRHELFYKASRDDDGRPAKNREAKAMWDIDVLQLHVDALRPGLRAKNALQLGRWFRAKRKEQSEAMLHANEAKHRNANRNDSKHHDDWNEPFVQPN